MNREICEMECNEGRTAESGGFQTAPLLRIGAKTNQAELHCLEVSYVIISRSAPQIHSYESIRFRW
jgi:hypothetical protein